MALEKANRRTAAGKQNYVVRSSPPPLREGKITVNSAAPKKGVENGKTKKTARPSTEEKLVPFFLKEKKFEHGTCDDAAAQRPQGGRGELHRKRARNEDEREEQNRRKCR